MAIYTMPSDAILFFKENNTFLEVHAVDADRRKFSDEQEAPRHYIDLEFYENWNLNHSISTINYSLAVADSVYTKDSLHSWGMLPWAIKSTYYQLVNAMQSGNVEYVLRKLSDLGHYVADGHVPLHTTVNYNGQLTGQKGIHALWESRIPELSWESYDLLAGKAAYIDDIDGFIESIISESHSQKDSVLELEAQLTKIYSEDGKYAIKNKYNGVKKEYSDDFIKEYEILLNGMVERKLRKSIRAVGSFWYTAWINSGQPDLSKL